MVEVKIIEGDITQVKSGALITAINAGGAWWGGIDGAIQRVANGLFHGQAAAAMPLSDGETVFAKGNGSVLFDNVIFAVDCLERPLSEVIYSALIKAESEKISSVTVPSIRMGVMRGVVEKTDNEAIEQLALGVESFRLQRKPVHLKTITFVIYDDVALIGHMKEGLLPCA
jgi:O-acetyl-ADP-ribose deacetylase (regulator of RNase III)